MIEKMLQALTNDSLPYGEIASMAVVTIVSIFTIRKLVNKICTPPAEPTEIPQATNTDPIPPAEPTEIPKDTSRWDSFLKAYPIRDTTEPVDDEASAALALLTRAAPLLKYLFETQHPNWSDSDNDDSDDNEPEITIVEPEITPVEPVDSEIRSLGADIKPESKIVEPEITPVEPKITPEKNS